MEKSLATRISKSDFLLYLEAPRHLWAEKHGVIKRELFEFDQHLIDEGYEVENLAREYFDKVFLPQHPSWRLLWQKTFNDGPFEARLDALIHKLDSNTYDLYEIKSATTPDKKDHYDMAFQARILRDQIPVDDYYLFHLNKEYIRAGGVDMTELFITEDLTDKVTSLLSEIDMNRSLALLATEADDPTELDYCLKPRECPCPDICHPGLPEFSIYDIPRLHQKKKLQLAEMGIRAAKDIPVDFALNDKQRLVAEMARSNEENLDQAALKVELDNLQFPLWFLDYETCISAIPRFDGYHPQQQIAFQYSLHRLEAPGGELTHSSFIAICDGDPSLPLLGHLSDVLGPEGSIIVWNKTFEMTINRDLALRCSEYAGFLENVNSRIYDLGEIVNRGIYLHPGFKGSWSIKKVLPVMVPELTYNDMEIHQGDMASMAWWNITFGGAKEEERDSLLSALEQYCELDTLAMVQIYQRFHSMINW